MNQFITKNQYTIIAFVVLILIYLDLFVVSPILNTIFEPFVDYIAEEDEMVQVLSSEMNEVVLNIKYFILIIVSFPILSLLLNSILSFRLRNPQTDNRIPLFNLLVFSGVISVLIQAYFSRTFYQQWMDYRYLLVVVIISIIYLMVEMFNTENREYTFLYTMVLFSLITSLLIIHKEIYYQSALLYFSGNAILSVRLYATKNRLYY